MKELSREKPILKSQSFRKPFESSSFLFKLKEKEVIKITSGYITLGFSLLPNDTKMDCQIILGSPAYSVVQMTKRVFTQREEVRSALILVRLRDAIFPLQLLWANSCINNKAIKLSCMLHNKVVLMKMITVTQGVSVVANCGNKLYKSNQK